MRRDLPDCLNPAPGDRWRRPLDEQDVAVRLETEGITDRVAQADWGASSTWDVARDAYRRVSAIEKIEEPIRPSSELVEHIKGMSFALPLALSCLAMLFLSFSLWGGDLPSEVAAAVAIGTVSSFVVTGGVVQAMARQGLFYAGTGELRMSEVTCRRWLINGAAVLLITAVVAISLNYFFEWLPYPLNWTAVAFHLLLGFFWLGTGVLYMLERNLLVSVAAAAGIAAVAGLHLLTGLPLIPAQLIGILLAALLATGLALHLLAKRAEGDSGRVHRLMPMRVLYLTAPYMAYGCLYYLLLFSDRLMAWTAQTHSASLPLVFRGDYELPLDIALFAFVLQVGWVHSSMLRFYSNVKSAQLVCEVDRVHEFNRTMQRFYGSRLLLFVPLAIAVSGAVWIAAGRAGFLADELSVRVALFALVGYPALVIGLWNVSLLFALSLPKAVLPAVAIATVANGGIGYFLSRALSYEWAVAGFAAGALAFGAISSVTVYRRFRDLDYYFFASAA